MYGYKQNGNHFEMNDRRVNHMIQKLNTKNAFTKINKSGTQRHTCNEKIEFKHYVMKLTIKGSLLIIDFISLTEIFRNKYINQD